MTAEIERTWRVRRLPEAVDPDDGTPIQQGYLTPVDAATEVRLRDRDGELTLTVKIGSGRNRDEVQLDIAPEDFDGLWARTAGARLRKRRVEVPHDDVVFEVDLFEGALAGLQLVEVEFGSEDAADRFEPPDWFGEEVTDDDRYGNRRLAAGGSPPPA